MPDKLIATTKYLNLVERDGWSFVTRSSGQDVVAVVPLLWSGVHEIILIEQFRKPVAARVIELPAGLAGDHGPEALLDVARRELLEETGYEANRWQAIRKSPASAGLTDEILHFFLAQGLRRVGPGGGLVEENEDIKVHVVPLPEVTRWLTAQERERDVLVSANVYAGIQLINVAMAD